ncbi:MAG: DUF5320 domain-containing protein [Spirochaetia bacterium]|nr:DUF5320 domain-containing protein [Spirochaetia bacterium]
MPGRNGTGPAGAGPRTGWGMGNCAPAHNEQAAGVTQTPEDTAAGQVPVPGAQVGFGRGLGRGLGRGFARGFGRGCGRGMGRGRW